jgi:[acyl-carrier-protein] S-malonyltransferase
MDKLAFVFSGQGAQYPGMGQTLYEHSEIFRAVFDRLDKLRPGLKELCFKGTPEDLALTINAQPCLFAVGLAAAKALAAENLVPSLLAGFSLGEVTALSYGQSFTEDEGFKFVCQRADFMHSTSQNKPGSMVVVLRMANEQIEALCQEVGGVYPVNYNCPGQLSVAGEIDQLKVFSERVIESGGRVVPLKVSGAFHTPLMDEAAEGISEALSNYQVQAPEIPVYSNQTAQPYDGDVKTALSKQVNHPVRWQTSIENMIAAGITAFVEVGAGGTLSGLIRKINPNVKIINSETLEGFQEAISQFGRTSAYAYR